MRKRLRETERERERERERMIAHTYNIEYFALCTQITNAANLSLRIPRDVARIDESRLAPISLQRG